MYFLTHILFNVTFRENITYSEEKRKWQILSIKEWWSKYDLCVKLFLKTPKGVITYLTILNEILELLHSSTYASFIQLYNHYRDNYMSSDETNLGLHQFRFYIKHVLYSDILKFYPFIWINILCSFYCFRVTNTPWQKKNIQYQHNKHRVIWLI
jgi:hypothetical protein